MFSWSVMGAVAHLQNFWEPAGSAALDLGEAEVISSPLPQTLSPGWTGRVWKAVKFGVCWHLRFPFAVFWIFYPLWIFVHKDAWYWIWWIDTWLQGFSSSSHPCDKSFPSVKIALISLFRPRSLRGALHNPNKGTELSLWRGRLLPLQGLSLRKGSSPTAAALEQGACQEHQRCTRLRDHTCVSILRLVCITIREGPCQLWKYVMKSVCTSSLSWKGIRNINETEKLAFEVASCSASNTCKGLVKFCGRKSNSCLESAL